MRGFVQQPSGESSHFTLGRTILQSRIIKESRSSIFQSCSCATGNIRPHATCPPQVGCSFRSRRASPLRPEGPPLSEACRVATLPDRRWEAAFGRTHRRGKASVSLCRVRSHQPCTDGDSRQKTSRCHWTRQTPRRRQCQVHGG